MINLSFGILNKDTEKRCWLKNRVALLFLFFNSCSLARGKTDMPSWGGRQFGLPTACRVALPNHYMIFNGKFPSSQKPQSGLHNHGKDCQLMVDNEGDSRIMTNYGCHSTGQHNQRQNLPSLTGQVKILNPRSKVPKQIVDTYFKIIFLFVYSNSYKPRIKY